MATRERWSFRELQRQLNGALFGRVVLSPAKLSPPMTELHPEAGTVQATKGEEGTTPSRQGLIDERQRADEARERMIPARSSPPHRGDFPNPREARRA
jgi:hypothetical protein